VYTRSLEHFSIAMRILRYNKLTIYSYAHYHTGTVAEPPISYNGKAVGGTRAKNMIGNISQREEELDIRGAEIDEAERRIAFSQADVREQTNSLIAREEYMQQREEALQQREQSVLQCENALQQRERANQQREQGQQHKHYQQREQGLSEREQTVTAREHANHEREQAFAVFEEGMLRQLECNYDGVASTVSQMRRAVGNAQGILANRRQQVLYYENFPHVAQGTLGPGSFRLPSASDDLSAYTLHRQICGFHCYRRRHWCIGRSGPDARRGRNCAPRPSSQCYTPSTSPLTISCCTFRCG
jgi:hypothetical protein